MKVYTLITVFFILFTSCQNNQNEVRFKGRIVNHPGEKMILADMSDRAGLRMPENITISLESSQEFDTSFVLETPGYYQIGNNMLYFRPGDRMEVVIDYENPKNSSFSGRGAQANQYLRGIPPVGPGAAGYLGRQGEHLRETIDDFINGHLRPQAEAHLQELSELKQLTHAFREMERARVRSNVVTAIMRFTAAYVNEYIDGFNFSDHMDTFRQLRNEHMIVAREVIMEYGEGLAKAENIVLPEFRGILVFVTDTTGQYLPPYQPVRRIDEYREAEALLQKYARCFTSFPTDLNPNEVLEELELAKSGMDTPLYRKIIDKNIAAYEDLKPGLPAFDFLAYDPEGQPHLLSQFKGKYIYIDFWATWCGPCIREYPHFIALAEEFEGREDIVFLAVSTDRDKEQWIKYMQAQPHEILSVHGVRHDLIPYRIAFIPRFVLIDKDFRFVDPFAPRPSQPEARELLLQLP